MKIKLIFLFYNSVVGLIVFKLIKDLELFWMVELFYILLE